MHLTILLQLVTAAMAKKSIMSTINFPKFGRGGPARAAIQQIQQPSKNDTYLVTPNTTRLVVLKVPHSGSTWFAALLNRFPRSYVKEESITKTRSNNVDPSAIHEHVGTSLIRPTDKMVASSAQIKFRGASHAIDATPVGAGSSLLEHLTHCLDLRTGRVAQRQARLLAAGEELRLRRLRTGPARPHDVPHALGAALRFPARRDGCHLPPDRQVQNNILGADERREDELR